MASPSAELSADEVRQLAPGDLEAAILCFEEPRIREPGRVFTVAPMRSGQYGRCPHACQYSVDHTDDAKAFAAVLRGLQKLGYEDPLSAVPRVRACPLTSSPSGRSMRAYLLLGD